MDLKKVGEVAASLCLPSRAAILSEVMQRRAQGCDEVTISELASFTGFSPSLTQHHVKKLTEQGLLSSREAGNKTLISIDAEGYAELEQSFKTFADVVGRMRSGVSEKIPDENE